MSRERVPKAPPPRWVSRSLWALDRVRYRVSGGRFILSAATSERSGTLYLRTLGRRSGQERAAILTYIADGKNLAVVAANAGARWEPAWWLNLQTSPEAYIDLPDGGHAVAGRAALPPEHERTWSRFVELDDAYEGYAAVAERPITVVILEPSRAPTSRSSG